MEISNYHEKDGSISLFVDSEDFERIVEHLRFKKLSVGGHHSDSSLSEVNVGATIDALNKALEDFQE